MMGAEPALIIQFECTATQSTNLTFEGTSREADVHRAHLQ